MLDYARIAPFVLGLALTSPWNGPAPLAGQTDRTVESAIQDLQSDGFPTDINLFRFRGCPQEDRIGREVFNAVKDVEMRGRELARLAVWFSQDTYPHCEFQDLTEWLVEVVERLHAAREEGALTEFADGVGQRTPELEPSPNGGYTIRFRPLSADRVENRLQRALIRVAEDSLLLRGVRERVATAALAKRPEELHVEDFVRFAGSSIPRTVKTRRIYYLSREFGSSFFAPVAAVAETLSDEDLFTLSSAIGTDVRDGRVDPNAEGLDEIRAVVCGRPSMPPWAHIPSSADEPCSGLPAN